MVSEGPMMRRGHGGCETCDEGSCDAACCARLRRWLPEPCWGPRRPLFCWGPTGIWVKADYLQWWESGTHVPALVTTGPNAANPGNIGTAWHRGALRQRLHQRQIGERRPHPGRNVAQSLRDHRFRGRVLRPGRREHQLLPLVRRQPDHLPAVLRRRARPHPARTSSSSPFPAAAPTASTARSTSARISRFHGAGAHFLFTTCRQEGCWTDDCGPARPTTTASAQTLSPAIGTWTWRINSASRKPSPTTIAHAGRSHESDGTQASRAFWSTISSTRRTRSTAAIWA